ncbi:hypothetical protein [Roseateles chitosanitabidus]|jgi:hypothetical protein|uniref:hypothetical protein n=1 Tax=Roseateles chitosanitabidus TaxID=65048 RepID=UPI0011DFE1AB|nr:hypothetical protein [Roseateles chitosanitabidus]
MNRSRPTYSDLKGAAGGAFREAVSKGGLTSLQAFAYTYEHLEIFIDGDDPWLQLLALTSTFMVAVEADVNIWEDELFAEDVLGVLRYVYAEWIFESVDKRFDSLLDVGLREDVEVVRSKYV